MLNKEQRVNGLKWERNTRDKPEIQKKKFMGKTELVVIFFGVHKV